jgi:hypothetical protein
VKAEANVISSSEALGLDIAPISDSYVLPAFDEVLIPPRLHAICGECER